MKKLLFILFCIACYTQISAQSLSHVRPKHVGMNAEKLKYVDTIITNSINNKEIPGAVVAVVRKGKMAYIKAYGNKQIYPTVVPMTINTVFDLASVSKSISTAICAMILIEQGKLRFNDKVNLFIPNFKAWVDSTGKKTDISILDILTHTSGLPPYAPVDECAKKYGAPNREGLIDYIANCKRDFAPKSDFQYSCLNYITLQKIIEIISGKDLDVFAQENIFDVLNMKHTSYRPQGKILELCAPTEQQKDGTYLIGVVHDPLARIMNGGISGNAGVFSNADDLAILCAALMNGGKYKGKRILSPLAVKKMRTIPESIKQFGRTPGWDVSSPYASNNGDLFDVNTFGHTGYTGTSLIIDPDNETAVILLTNRAHPADKGSVVRLRALVANAVAGSIEN